MPDIPSRHIDWHEIKMDMIVDTIDIREEVSKLFHEQIMRKIDSEITKAGSKFWHPDTKKKKVNVGPGIDENGIPVDNLVKEVDVIEDRIRFVDYNDKPFRHWNHTYINPFSEER